MRKLHRREYQVSELPTGISNQTAIADGPSFGFIGLIFLVFILVLGVRYVEAQSGPVVQYVEFTDTVYTPDCVFPEGYKSEIHGVYTNNGLTLIHIECPTIIRAIQAQTDTMVFKTRPIK